MALIALLQATTVEATQGGTTAQGGTTVYLAPEQMAELVTQGQANVAYIVGFFAFALVALAGIQLRSSGA